MKVIDIFNSDGTVSPYRLLSDRLPDFLGRHGPEQGYAIVIEAQDPLSLRPGLLRLYEAAIAAGHSPEAVGLPPPKDISMVFQAKLLDREGRMVCNASALKPIREYQGVGMCRNGGAATAAGGLGLWRRCAGCR